jgi:transcription elongation factor Elf1
MSFSRGHVEELLIKGLAAAKSGDPRDRQEAEFYLEWVLVTDANMDQQSQAWYWLSRVTEDPEKRKECLENVLSIQPTHPDARRDRAILEGRLKVSDMRANPVASGMAVAQSQEVSAQQSRRFRCPKCGASASFDSNVGMLRCQFCGTQIDEQGEAIEQAAPVSAVVGEAVSEQDWIAAIHTEVGHRWALPQDRMLECQGCGAHVTFASSRASARCAYCGSPYAVRAVEDDLREPDGIILFGGDAVGAATQARKCLVEQGARIGVPDDLPGLATLQVPTPIYLPFWTFDMGGEVRWSGWVREEMDIAGVSVDELDNAVRVGGIALGVFTGNFDFAARTAADMVAKKYDRSNMVHTSGAVGVVLDDVLVPGTTSLPPEMLGKLKYETRRATPYDAGVLADWPAEVYSVSMADASLSARQQAIKEADEQVALHTGQLTPAFGDSMQINRAGIAVISYKLLLLPLWVVEYTYREKSYRLLVNGQTGLVVGDPPPSSNPAARFRLFGR